MSSARSTGGVGWFAVGVAVLVGGVRAQDAATDDLRYARVQVDSADLRCFPTEHSPVYGERLTKADVVKVGSARDGFLPVVLPLGVLGYVHDDYASERDGMIQSDANKLAFRYRPNSREAPVRFVDKGTTFHLVGKEQDWWKVRFPGVTAWVPVAAVAVFDDGAEIQTLDAAYRDLDARQRAASEAAVQSIVDKRAAAAAQQARVTKLGELRTRFQNEYRKPNAEQSYDVLTGELATLAAELPEGSDARLDADALQQQITLQVQLLAATRLIATEPVPAQVPDLGPPAVEDPMKHLTAIGWLRYDDGLFGKKTVRLEKGGQVLYLVTCSSGRYDLRLFDGVEVGIRGNADRPHVESLRVLDVERIEVFGRR